MAMLFDYYWLDVTNIEKEQGEMNVNETFPLKEERVIEEANRVANNSQTDNIKLKNMQKIYENGFIGVKNMSFGVQPG